MPVIQKEVVIAAGASNDNIFAGSAFEFARTNQLVSLGVTASVTGAFITFQSGADIVLEESPPIVKTVMPVVPDDFLYTDVAAAGDRYVLRGRNPTGGAITVRAVLQIQDIR
jgi:hypothetical protein